MNPEAKTALAAAAAAFQAADLRLREADLLRRVHGEVVPTACWACGTPGATYGPPRRVAGYRACPDCWAAEFDAGGETRFRFALAATLLEITGHIGPEDSIPAVEGPAFCDDVIGASPARPVEARWTFLTDRMIDDLAERAGVAR